VRPFPVQSTGPVTYRPEVARPSKFSPSVGALIVEAVSRGATRDVAAEAAGVSPSTLYRWLREAADVEERAGVLSSSERALVEFLESVKKATAAVEVEALDVIRSAAEGGTWQAAAWLLERRHPERWGRRARVEPVRGKPIIRPVEDILRSLGVGDEESLRAVADVG
jgi:transposase-like protein